MRKVPLIAFLAAAIFSQTAAQPQRPNVFAGNMNVEVLPAEGLNSQDLEFCAVPFGTGILFTSNRQHERANVFDQTEKMFCTDLWFAERKGFAQFSEPKPLEGNLNTRYHEGAASIFPGGKRMVFSRNAKNGCEKTGKMGVNIFEAGLEGKNWQNAIELPINLEGYTTCHPTLSADGKWLVFASDRPGTLGGMDLWVSSRTNLGWSQPANLGPEINSAGNEVFPFLAADGMLFFSSNGRAGGLGKLDVFCAKPLSPENWADWSLCENLGEPFNSTADDFGFSILPDGTGGFLSSNRSQNSGDDIFEWRVLQLVPEKTVEAPVEKPKMETPAEPSKPNFAPGINGLVREKMTLKPIAASQILLRNLKTGTTQNLASDAAGAFVFEKLDCETDYLLIVGAERPNPEKREFSTKNQCDSLGGKAQNLLVEFASPEKEKKVLENLGVAEVKAGSVIRLNKLYYDLGKSEIRPDAAAELEKVIELMVQYPKMVIELSSHTDCRGSSESNRSLSQRRAEAARDYIVSKGSISGERISSSGLGETQPVNRCIDGVKCSETEYQENRRTEIRVVAL